MPARQEKENGHSWVARWAERKTKQKKAPDPHLQPTYTGEKRVKYNLRGHTQKPLLSG